MIYLWEYGNMSVQNFDANITSGNYLRPKTFRFWCQKVLPLVYDDSLSYYELLCKVVDYLNRTMHDVNEVIDQVDALDDAFVALQEYVNDYFADLNVQEQINNKLDEMAEDGTLDELLLPYFNQYVEQADAELEVFKEAIEQEINKIYDNVAEMLADDTLTSGKVCKTLGYYEAGDEGGAYYKITDTAPAGYYETLENGLYAELVVDKVVNPRMFGAKGDGTTNDAPAIQNALNTLRDVFFSAGVYYVSTQITIPQGYFRHVIYSNSTSTTHDAIIKAGVYPTFVNNDSGFAIIGLGFTSESIPSLGSGETPESKAYLYFDGYDDIDIVVKDCGFEKNNCMIRAKGRNMIITGCLFYDMNNANYCIYLDYPDDADGESDTNINGFKNSFSGFRGFLITNNRCHYTRNWLLNTEATNCQNMKGLVVADNYLEGAFCIRGYLNNALVVNNRTFQVNHYDLTDARKDACFWLKEMKYSIIDGYSAEGSDSYVNKDGVTIDEATMAFFLIVEGDAVNSIISNVYATNFRTGAISFAGNVNECNVKINLRRTMNSPSSTISIIGGVKGSIFDVIMNDLNSTPDSRPIINFNAGANQGHNHFRVSANYDCVPYAFAPPNNVESMYYMDTTLSFGSITGGGTKDATLTVNFSKAPAHVSVIVMVATVVTPIAITSLTASSVGIRLYNASSSTLTANDVPLRLLFAFT